MYPVAVLRHKTVKRSVTPYGKAEPKSSTCVKAAVSDKFVISQCVTNTTMFATYFFNLNAHVFKERVSPALSVTPNGNNIMNVSSV